MNVLETPRLLLRTWQEDDIETMAAINQDPRVCRYLPGVGNRVDTEALIQRMVKHYDAHGFSLFAVELKSTGKLIGYVGIQTVPFETQFTPAVEMGWRLDSNYWQQGYATEAARAVLGLAFDKLSLPEIVSFTAQNNIPSRRVMDKIGMHHHSKDDFDHPKLALTHPLCRHVLYRMTQQDYLAQYKMIHFVPFDDDYVALWRAWVEKPHVKNVWFVEGYASVDEILAAKQNNGYDYPFIICLGKQSIGYIQACDLHAYQTLCKKPTGLFTQELPGTFCMDLFIGDEAFLNRGYGTQIVSAFVDYIFEQFGATKVLIDPASTNRRAISCYEKAGFEPLKTAHDGITECLIMQKASASKFCC